MVLVKAGRFTLGSEGADPLRGFGDLNLQGIGLGNYCIDVYEHPNQRGSAPTVNVPWAKAKKTCEAAGKRLCTEAEWEKACKGPGNLRFPYGNKQDDSVCNVGDGRAVARAGEFSRCRSGYGVLDLAGNVAEWTASRWSDDISDKVVKGGAADQASFTGRCAARVNEAAASKQPNLGFRCCADAR